MKWLLRFLKNVIVKEIDLNVDTMPDGVHIEVKFLGQTIFQKIVKI